MHLLFKRPLFGLWLSAEQLGLFLLSEVKPQHAPVKPQQTFFSRSEWLDSSSVPSPGPVCCLLSICSLRCEICSENLIKQIMCISGRLPLYGFHSDSLVFVLGVGGTDISLIILITQLCQGEYWTNLLFSIIQLIRLVLHSCLNNQPDICLKGNPVLFL